MKSFIAYITVACLIASGSANATDMPELAKKNNCTACHKIDKKLVGPAWNDVAARYRSDASAEAYLIRKVANGGSGVWGTMPEIPNSRHVSNEDIKALVQFVLSLNQPSNISANEPALPPVNAPTSNPIIECVAKIESQKELQILKGKIELSESDQLLEILANDSRPTENERKAISIWVSEHQKCDRAGEEWLNSGFSPALTARFNKARADVYFLAADLYAKKISYGDFAKGQIRIEQEFKSDLAAGLEQLHQQQQAEIQRSDALARQQQKQTEQQQAALQQRNELAKQQQRQDERERDVRLWSALKKYNDNWDRNNRPTPTINTTTIYPAPAPAPIPIAAPAPIYAPPAPRRSLGQLLPPDPTTKCTSIVFDNIVQTTCR